MTTSTKGTLRAIIREMEPNVFKAEYPGEMNQDEAGVEAFPDSHIGTDAVGVKVWVETMAKDLGYERVVWEPPKVAASL
ncbi:MAG TPA: hypothetical protein VGM42_08405 [Rhodopila sp.]|jgi:hypothetical protein